LVTVAALGGFLVAAGFVARGAVLALGGFCVATASFFNFASADAGGPLNFKGTSGSRRLLSLAGGFRSRRLLTRRMDRAQSFDV
jgi:hypothetical protein